MNREPTAFTRRQFLGNGLMLTSAALAVPSFIHSSASAMTNALLGAGVTSLPGVPDDHILVVVQLSGGNDGLNTVIPFGYGEYYKARPGIGVPADQVLKLSGVSEGVGLHPQMTGLKELHDQGMLAVVQGVGYPNPNRSHFKSMDIWHTADISATGDGWLGRYFDSECCGYGKGESGSSDRGKKDAGTAAAVSNQPGIAIGRSAPLAMQGRKIKPISFESADLFRWIGQDIHESLSQPYNDINRRGDAAGAAGGDTNAAFLMRTALDAQISSDMIRKAVSLRPSVQFPNTDIGRQLSMISCMIRAGLKTRVYYANHGGFDTHAGQGAAQGRHGNLLGQFAQAMQAFYKDLKAHENDTRVLTMSFSEFGRRVRQNASGGTDHGTAAPLFLMGPMVKSGVLNTHPSMQDLDDGDLKYRVDFRTVYAGILENWLKADSRTILEGSYRPMDVIKKA